MRADIPVPPEQSYEHEPDAELEPVEARGFNPAENDVPLSGVLTPEDHGRLRRFRGPDREPDATLHRHITHCTICNHPDRDAIDQCILHWESPTAIADEFDLGDRRVIWRHARALGLFRIRMEQSQHALGFLIEQAQSVVPSADAIIRAIRALSCLDENGHWHEPRKEVVITHRYEQVPAEGSHDGPPRRRPRPRPPQPGQSRPADSVAGRFLRSVAGVFSPAPRDERRSGGPSPFLGTRAEKSST